MAYPFSAVAEIISTFGDGFVGRGSGVIVGPNDILTAAHMVYDAVHGTAVSVTASPGYNNGSAQFGTVSAASWNYLEWDANRDDLVSMTEAANDVAILGFHETLSRSFGSFTMDPDFVSGPIHVTGYPARYDGPNGAARMTDDLGSASASRGVFVLSADTEVNPGNSGGPVWYDSPGGPRVVGVISTASWAADVYTHYQQLQDWMAGNNTLMTSSLAATQGDATALARLYEAALNRPYDTPGLNGWIDRYEAGASTQSIARQFLDSAEFTAHYGDDDLMTNDQFVTLLYSNVLDRAPDPTGFTYWVGKMGAGMTREQVLINFADSPENISHAGYLASLHEASAGWWVG